MIPAKMLLGLDVGLVISKAVLVDESFTVQGRWWLHSPSENTKLEAFVYQVQRFAQKKEEK